MAWLLVSTISVCAQANPSQCVSKITERLEALGQAAEFDFLKAREIMNQFDFGTVQAAVSDPAKAAAFKRVFTSLSEFIDLAPNDISSRAMKGYTRFSGGIIRSTGVDFVADLKKVFGDPNFDGPGFNKVMEQLDGTGTWPSQGKWQSPEGLVFDVAPNNRQGHRLSHVFTHTVPGWNGRLQADHSVFTAARQDILPLLDQAWKNRPAVNPNDPGAFLIDMGNQVVGTTGEKKILIIVKPNTGEIITAYPQP